MNKIEFASDPSVVETLSKSIEIREPPSQFAVSLEAKISEFAENTLQHVEDAKSDAVKSQLGELLGIVRRMNVEGLILVGWIGRQATALFDSKRWLLGRYQKGVSQMSQIGVDLDNSRLQLVRDAQVLENFLHEHLKYFDEVNIHILAGEAKVEASRKTVASKFVRAFEKRLKELRRVCADGVEVVSIVRFLLATNQELVAKVQTPLLDALARCRELLSQGDVDSLKQANAELPSLIEGTRRLCDTTLEAYSSAEREISRIAQRIRR